MGRAGAVGSRGRLAGAALALLVSVGTALPVHAQQSAVPAETARAALTSGLPLQQQAEEIIGAVSGSWGVVAWSITEDRQLIAINSSEPLIPASNNKVFTAIWALDELGAEYRFPTDLLLDGPIENGVLRGDVILRGSGDPAFGYPPRLGFAEFIEPPMTPLHRMAARVAAEGIQAVEGSVIGDPMVFDSVLVGPAWPNDTGAGAAQYAPRVSGLPFQRNMIWVEVGPGAGGSGPQAVLDPPVSVVPLLATVRTGSGRALAVRRPQEDTIRISGAVPASGVNRYGVGVADPALMTADALRIALLEIGVQVRGASRVAAAPETARHIHRHYSMPLGGMIPFLNRNSDNFFAEHLWKAAAASAVGEGSYRLGGTASALHFIQQAGLEPGELYQFDGSGLSHQSRASAAGLVKALVYAHRESYSDLFHRSMAVAADPSGSLSRLYRNSAAANNLHAKTGFISRVRTLSGYVEAANGELIAFSFLYNGANTNGARAAQEELGILLAEYGGANSP